MKEIRSEVITKFKTISLIFLMLYPSIKNSYRNWICPSSQWAPQRPSWTHSACNTLQTTNSAILYDFQASSYRTKALRKLVDITYKNHTNKHKSNTIQKHNFGCWMKEKFQLSINFLDWNTDFLDNNSTRSVQHSVKERISQLLKVSWNANDVPRKRHQNS